MRWNTNRRAWRKGFALFPLESGDGETIWLRFYWFRSWGDHTQVDFGRERPAE